MAKKIGLYGKLRHGFHYRRQFDHHADGRVVVMRQPFFLEPIQAVEHHLPGPIKIVQRGDQGKHDAHRVATDGGTQDGADLLLKDIR